MFDYKKVTNLKAIWSLSIFFLHVKSKITVIEKLKVKEYDVYNHNQVLASQNLLYMSTIQSGIFAFVGKEISHLPTLIDS